MILSNVIQTFAHQMQQWLAPNDWNAFADADKDCKEACDMLPYRCHGCGAALVRSTVHSFCQYHPFQKNDFGALCHNCSRQCELCQRSNICPIIGPPCQVRKVGTQQECGKITCTISCVNSICNCCSKNCCLMHNYRCPGCNTVDGRMCFECTFFCPSCEDPMCLSGNHVSECPKCGICLCNTNPSCMYQQNLCPWCRE